MQRLNDQYAQSWKNKITQSGRFLHLITEKDSYSRSSYTHEIQNPIVRKVYTRLRIDLNILATSKVNSGKNMSAICPLCKSEPETVKHFLLKCCHYEQIRNKFLEDIKQISPGIQNETAEHKLKYILDLRCPDEAITLCCKFVSNIYGIREKFHSNSD